MNEAEYRELMEAGWRRRLTPAEQAQLHAWLAEHPEQRAATEDEAGLSHLLERLPDAPVASNFTALVLQAARREAAQPAPRPFLGELWARLFPRPAAGAAWLALMCCLGWLAVQQTQSNRLHQRATELVTVSGAAALSDPSLLEDFDAIRRLPQPEDEELFAVLSTVPAN
jgi:anti-sigma factor RsiW